MADPRTLSLETEGGVRTDDAAPGVLLLFSEGTLPAKRCVGGPGRLTIGRAADQRITIDDAGMSRLHATLTFRRGGGATVRDEGSSNGTRVNGHRAEREVEVTAGDVIRFGTTVAMVVEDASAFDGWPDSALTPPLIGGPALAAVRRELAFLASESVNLLIVGESGTGKTLAARYVHDAGGAGGAFIAENCAAIPETLFEAKLFGVRKGAFTDAKTDRPGMMELARDGTLFLDEIGELPRALQAKLLHAVEQHEVWPVGAQASVRVDLRLVTATNRDLDDDARQGRFREDLYHRLSGEVVALPPLRSRREDVVILAERLVADGEAEVAMTAPFVEGLLLHPWPGNVRELRHAVERACRRARMDGRAKLDVGDLRLDERTTDTTPAPSTSASSSGPTEPLPDHVDLREEVSKREAELILRMLGESDWDRVATAKRLGLPVRTLAHKMKTHGIRRGTYRQDPDPDDG